MTRQLISALGVVVCLSTAACGPSTQQARGTERAAGADANVTIENIEGGNRMVVLVVDHLPPPERVAAGHTRYVMWFSKAGQTSVMASTLEYDPGSRRGRARATTPLTGFEIVVTAERAAASATPSEHVVVRHRAR